LIELASLEDFRAEVKSDLVQSVAREFRTYADAPQFLLTEDLAPVAR